MCNACPTGKYSIEEGSTECSICPKNAQCPGKDQIWVNEGFWRSSNQSSTIHECFDKSSCPGVDNENDDPDNKGYKCALGHDGNLCTVCIVDKKGKDNNEEVQYQRTGDHRCA